MSTFKELTDSTLLFLSGFSAAQDQATYLTALASSSATVLSVADASALSRGLIEIGDELIWADVADTAANQLTLPPYGRGYRGTTAVSHATGERVVAAPLFPRVLVKRAITEVIDGLYPDLFQIKNYEFTYVPGQYTYQIPADVGTVISIKWQDITAASDWVDVRRWDLDPYADPTVFGTKNSLTLKDPIIPGRTVNVVYAAKAGSLVNDSDVFATVTGLPSSCEDVIRLGAAARMIPFLDSPHLIAQGAEADFSSSMRPVGAAATLGKYLLQNYTMRLDQESRKLQDQFPVRVRYTF